MRRIQCNRMTLKCSSESQIACAGVRFGFSYHFFNNSHAVDMMPCVS